MTDQKNARGKNEILKFEETKKQTVRSMQNILVCCSIDFMYQIALTKSVRSKPCDRNLVPSAVDLFAIHSGILQFQQFLCGIL